MNLNIRNKSYLQRVSLRGFDGVKLSEAFDDVGKGVDNVAAQMGADPNGSPRVPPSIAKLEAQHLGNGILDFAITDNGTVNRAIDYVVELADNPNFSGARTVHFSPSRNGTAMVPNGDWYLKAYSQYRLGGPPSGALTSGKVTVTGSASKSLFGTQGCGAAPANTTGQGAGLTVSR